MGIRAVSRLTGLDKKTVLRILVSAGERCAYLLDAKIQDVKAENVQVDEIYTFVNCKPQNTTRDDVERGEFFTYLSVDRISKLIINWRTSKRNANYFKREPYEPRERILNHRCTQMKHGLLSPSGLVGTARCAAPCGGHQSHRSAMTLPWKHLNNV